MMLAPVAPDHTGSAAYNQTHSGDREGSGFATPALAAQTSITAASGLLGCPIVGRSEFGTFAPVIRTSKHPTWTPWAGDLWTPAVPQEPAIDVLDGNATDVRSDQNEVLWVKENSGLTWDQLGKVFGVSRRAVHLWANGGRLNQANAEVLRRFAAEVAAHRGGTPEETRAALLAHNVIDTFRRAQIRGPGEAIGAPFAPEEKVENVRGVEAAEP